MKYSAAWAPLGTVAQVDDYVFPEGWWDLRGNDAEAERMRDRLERELRRELASDHLLYRRGVRAVARCQHCDEALFDLGDGEFALVHLSWPHTGPDRSPWPRASVVRNWTEATNAVERHSLME